MTQRIVVERQIEFRRGGMFGNMAGPIITLPFINKSGGALARGDVVVLDKTSNSTADYLALTTTTTADNVDVVGMVYEAVANNAWGKVQVWGPTDALKVDGTTDIAIGDYLCTFTTAKIAQKATAGEGTFAVALEAYAANDSNGVIDAFITRLDFIRATGKTIASGATIQFNAAAGSYANLIKDVNGNEILDTRAVASALNQFGISNGATGNGPTLEARGETNVDINLLAKGTGAVILNNDTDPVILKLLGAAGGANNVLADLNGNEIVTLQGVASAVNEVAVTNAVTGAKPAISATGGDTNISLGLTSKGSGVVLSTNSPVLEKKAAATNSTDSNQTYTAAQVLGGIIARSGITSNRVDAFPVAADIVAAIPGAVVGTSFLTLVSNADDAQTITVNGASNGITYAGSAATAIAAGAAKLFLTLITNVGGGTEAATVYGI